MAMIRIWGQLQGPGRGPHQATGSICNAMSDVSGHTGRNTPKTLVLYMMAFVVFGG